MSDDGSDDQRKPLELEREQWHRQCRKELLSFAVAVMQAR
jgi:hypothetical protein